MERKSFADRQAARAAQEAEAAAWLAQNAGNLADTVAVSSIEEDEPTPFEMPVGDATDMDADASFDRAAQAEAEATSATYRGEA
jgi:hypothetical protein